MIRRAALFLTGCALLTVGCMPSPVIRRELSDYCLQALRGPEPAEPTRDRPHEEHVAWYAYRACRNTRDDIARTPVWHLSPGPSTVAEPVRCIRLPSYMVTCY